MLKKSLILILLGSAICSSAFASLEKHFTLKKQVMKKSITTRSNNTPSNFFGTWTGSCKFSGEDSEVNWKIAISGDGAISIEDNGSAYLTGSKYAIGSNTYAANEFYAQGINKVRTGSDNTIVIDLTEIFAFHNTDPSSPAEDLTPLSTEMTAITLSIKNNQLVVDGKYKQFLGIESNNAGDFKCNLNKAIN